MNHFSGLVGPMLGLWWAGFGRFGKFGESLVGFGWLQGILFGWVSVVFKSFGRVGNGREWKAFL